LGNRLNLIGLHLLNHVVIWWALIILKTLIRIDLPIILILGLLLSHSWLLEILRMCLLDLLVVLQMWVNIRRLVNSCTLLCRHLRLILILS